MDRKYATVGHSNSSTVSAKLSSNPLAGLEGTLGYDHTVKSAETHYWLPWNVLSNSATPVYSYPSVPFYQAPLVADSVRLRTNYVPNDKVALGVFGRVTTNNYKYPGVTPFSTLAPAGTPPVMGYGGTTRDMNVTIGPDLTYTPRKDIQLHSFYTFERIFYENHGNGILPTNAIPAAGQWSASTTDDVHTVGLSAEWQATEKLKLGTGYTFWYGDVTYELFNGVQVAAPVASYQNVQPFPTIPSSLHSFKVYGEYQLAANMVMGVGAGFDMFKDNDWAYYSWAPAVQTSLTGGGLTTGVGSPSYRVYSGVTTLKVKF